jgi:hypothetical protein
LVGVDVSVSRHYCDNRPSLGMYFCFTHQDLDGYGRPGIVTCSRAISRRGSATASVCATAALTQQCDVGKSEFFDREDFARCDSFLATVHTCQLYFDLWRPNEPQRKPRPWQIIEWRSRSLRERRLVPRILGDCYPTESRGCDVCGLRETCGHASAQLLSISFSFMACAQSLKKLCAIFLVGQHSVS